MIRSFRDRDSARLARRERVRRYQGFERVALRKLAMIEAASVLDDLRAPPGNRLEALRATGRQHSIRINDQWRICFVWRDGEAHDVEICDYH